MLREMDLTYAALGPPEMMIYTLPVIDRDEVSLFCLHRRGVELRVKGRMLMLSEPERHALMRRMCGHGAWRCQVTAG